LSSREYKEWEVLELLETMEPFPNKDLLAQQLSDRNKIEPRRYGSGATTSSAMRKYILRAENKSKKRMKGTDLELFFEERRQKRLEERKAAARRRLKNPKP
jgi:hypothetical protein